MNKFFQTKIDILVNFFLVFGTGYLERTSEDSDDKYRFLWDPELHKNDHEYPNLMSAPWYSDLESWAEQWEQ